MRWMLTLALALLATGCFYGDADDEDDDGSCLYMGVRHPLGSTFPAGDGCNTCACEPEGVACTLVACEVPDAAPTTCQPTGGCAVGPACGGVCCDTGERCVAGVCRCGDNPACPSGDSCEAAGPIGGDACGAICCGASGPCPQ